MESYSVLLFQINITAGGFIAAKNSIISWVFVVCSTQCQGYENELLWEKAWGSIGSQNCMSLCLLQFCIRYNA